MEATLREAYSKLGLPWVDAGEVSVATVFNSQDQQH